MELLRWTNAVLTRAGYQLRPLREVPADFDALTRAIVEPLLGTYSMTSPERLYAACHAARYVARTGVPGAIVECGVWRGGSMMAMARALLEVGESSRELFLFDTFEGMPPPEAVDRFSDGRDARTMMERYGDPETGGFLAAGIDDVRHNLASTGYPTERTHFVKGKVEDTVPDALPERIALLRLDTDWYASTKHELEHMLPLLSPGGVLIIDDYGDWEGARRAVDEYFAAHSPPVLLTRIDATGRLAVFPADR